MSSADLSKLKINRDAPSSFAAKPGRRKLKIALVVLVVVIAAVFAGARYNSVPTVETVTVAKAYPSQNYTLLNATGYVVAQRKAAVGSKASGRLEWLGVLEGSRVKQGEVIARLENRDVTAALDQAAANVKVAQANLEQGMAEFRDAEAAFQRSKELLEKKFISPASHDTAVARYNKAKAAISGYRAAIVAAQAGRRAAEVNLEQTLIRAPFDGVILTKSANVGDNVTPFSSAADTKGAVVNMADMDTLEVEADVSESSLSKIQVDQACEIQLEAFPDVRLAGVVSRMVPTVDRTKATLLVKVKFEERDPRVLPDMSAKVAFLSRPVPAEERSPVTAVQPAAIVERDGKKIAFLVKADKADKVQVTTGKSIGELIAVSGVAPGDKLVLNPSEKVTDGGAVNVGKR
ncbi:MAG TPA: efflux RND transporter periplasmic adaptor subunit [Burkholderiales bacterium]|nr:efflux RND transporter periplasmic adaptor subunit [Burkholderiales bacterium]